MKRLISLILALSVALSNTALATGFSIDTKLSHGLTLIESTTTLPDGKDSHTFVFEYTPGLSSMPVVAWGKSQKSRKTLMSIMESYGDNVVAGLNADFFSFYTGIPLGCVVSEGRFLSSSVNNNALLVHKDGTLEIGTPDITSSFTYGEDTFDFYYNKYPQVYSLYIMDSTYSDSTASTFDSLEILLEPEGELLLNSSVECRVAELRFDVMDSEIPEGKLVLNVPNSHKSFEKLSQMQEGETLTINVTSSEPWSQAEYVIGGGDIIVKDFTFQPETVNEYADRVRNARSAVGIRVDGTGIFFAVNGKKEGYSSGMTLEELANELIAMGAETVLNFDGGGSTTVGVKYLGADEAEVVNYGSDGYPRRISNAVLFLNVGQPDGIVTSVTLFPSFYFVLPNTFLEANQTFFDSSMTVVEDVEIESSDYYPLSEGVGISDNKMFVTEDGDFERIIGARYIVDGKEITDYKSFYVPESLDFFEIKAESQVLGTGESTIVSVDAFYSGFSVENSLQSFSWRFEENNVEELGEGVLAENDIARLNADGTLSVVTEELFTATTLYASFGETEHSINIYVGMPDIVLDDFEPIVAEAPTEETPTEESATEETSTEETPTEETPTEETATEETPTEETPVDEITTEETTDTQQPDAEEEITEEPVEVGYRSNTAGIIETDGFSYESPIELALRPKAITLMLKGEYKTPGTLEIINADGEVISIEYKRGDDYSVLTGWTQLVAEIPTELGNFYVKSPFTSTEQERAVIDNLTATYGFALPVFDDVEGNWAKDYIETIYDMGLISGYTEDGKTLFAPARAITRAEFAKLVTIYQNYSIEQEGSLELSFNDNEAIPEWAVGYIGAVAQNNVMNGRAEGDGTLTFAPNDPISRTEAMLVLSRIMPEIAELVELEFSDTQDVPEWALDGVRSVVTSGIITGYDDNTIRPANNITRGEVAAVFSRLFNYMYPYDEQPARATDETVEEDAEIPSDETTDENTGELSDETTDNAPEVNEFPVLPIE